MKQKWLLLPIFFISLISKSQDFKFTEVIPSSTYDEIADRISCIQKKVPLNFNERVKAFIDYFAIKNREYTKDIIKKKELYFPIFSEALRRHNMPDEIKYLAIVESGLRPNAISKANAVGLWQFISSTGKNYGLHSNWYLDERMDPIESSDAASRYLNRLYQMFGDWELALAAYNCGPSNVRKAIRKSGYKKKFWEIYRYLPRETRSYLPQFVAITYLFNHLEEHGFIDQSEFFSPQMDTIIISQYFHLETFCNQLNICLDDMLQWNPQIKRGVIPEGTKNFALRIPSDLKKTIIANRKQLYDTASKVGKKHLEYLAKNTSGSTYGRERLYYKVKNGDVLGTIAQQYSVRISDLRAWNKLKGNLIRINQRLSIWVLPTYHSKTKQMYATNTKKSTLPIKKNNTNFTAKGELYIVKKGDSLWSIGKKNNLSTDKLRLANNLKSNIIKTGQSLIIPN